MADTTIPVHDGSKFDWHGNHGAIEFSDLISDKQPVFTYIDEASGFYVRSHRTGACLLFTMTSIERDGEGDVIAYHLKTEDGRFNVSVYND